MKKVLCIDIGGSKVSFSLRDKKATYFEEKIYYNEHNINNKKKFKEVLIDTYKKTKPFKISISVAGFIKNNTVITSPNASWMNELNFTKIFPTKEVYVENDANVFAYSQYLKTRKKNLVGIIWGTGIGMGIIYNGKIMKGDSFTGEVGHTLADYKKGTTYESLLSSNRIMSEYKKEKDEVLYPREIYQKDKEWFYDYTLKPLSSLITNVYQILGIKTFVFGGGIGSNLDNSYYKILKKEVKEKIHHNPDKNITINMSKTSQEDIYNALLFLSKRK